MMKWTKMLGVFVLLTIITSVIPLCQATIEKDFSCTERYFSFTIRMIIETEKDGTWRNNTLYHIQLLATLNSIDEKSVGYLKINQTWIDFSPSWGQVVEYQDELRPSLSLVGSTVLVSRYTVKLQMPYIPTSYRFTIRSNIAYLIYSPYPYTLIGSLNWWQLENVYIEVTDTDTASQLSPLQNELSTIRNLMYVLISTTIIIIAITTYIAIKKHKSIVKS